MARRTTRGAVLSVLSLLTLTVAGCGSGGSSAAGEPGGADDAVLGPLDAYFEQAYGEYDEDQANRDMRRVEEVMATCMAEQGFEYTPADYSSQTMSMSSDDLDVEWGTREFAEQYGYGVTTDPYGDATQVAPEEEFLDPNAEYVEAMSESEAEAYYLALYGDQTAMEDPEAEYVYDWEQSGCQGRADNEVHGRGEAGSEVVSLEEDMGKVWERVGEDPRVLEVSTAWVDCMGDAGITGMASVDEGSTRISDKANAVYEEVYPAEATMQEPSEEDMAELEAQVQERLGAITEEEIATAVADFDCREDVGYDDTYQEVNLQLQQEFVDAHREELDAWVEATAAD